MREFETPTQVGIRINRSDRTLRTYREMGTGPAYLRIGNRILYRTADVNAWLVSRTFNHRAAEITGRVAA